MMFEICILQTNKTIDQNRDWPQAWKKLRFIFFAISLSPDCCTSTISPLDGVMKLQWSEEQHTWCMEEDLHPLTHTDWISFIFSQFNTNKQHVNSFSYLLVLFDVVVTLVVHMTHKHKCIKWLESGLIYFDMTSFTVNTNLLNSSRC